MVYSVIHSWTPYGGHWVVLDEKRQVTGYRVSRWDDRAGSVLMGRVCERLPEIRAALVDVGGSVPGFLRNAGHVTVGQAIRVRVRSEAKEEKGAILTEVDDSVPLGLSHPLKQLAKDCSDLHSVQTDDEESCLAFRAMGYSAVCLPPLSLWHGEVGEALADLDAPLVRLPSGGRLVMERTAALLAVDVDSGSSSPAVVNREAVLCLARQIRLRNIGGQIVVDLVGSGEKQGRMLAGLLQQALADDPVPSRVLGIGPLGLLELRRERRGISLDERFSGVNGCAMRLLDGFWRAVASDSALGGGRPWVIRAHPAVAEAVVRLSDDFGGVVIRRGRRPSVVADPDLSEDAGRITV